MDVCEYLEELQPIMEDIISDYEFEGADKEKVTDLETALSHLYKAYDLVNEIVAEDFISADARGIIAHYKTH